MPRSYQRACRAIGFGFLLASACGRPETPIPAPPVPLPDPARIVASATYEPVGVLEDGDRAVANETRGGRVRAVVVRRDGAMPEAQSLLPAAASQSRAIGIVAGARVALVTPRDDPPGAVELHLVAPEGAVDARIPLDLDERVVAVAVDGSRFWTAIPDPPGERWVERSLPTGIVRPAPPIPRGFEIAAVDGRGERAILRRTIEPGRDEVVLFERSAESATLLLPTDRDGAFAPLALDAEGARLLVAARETERPPRLLEIDLATGAERTLPGPPCAATAGRPLGATGWIVRRRCADRVRLDAVDSDAALPPPPEAGVSWRALVPIPGGGWLGAASAPGAPDDLWRVDASGDRLPLTWGLDARLDPRSLPVPQPIELGAGGRRIPAVRWPAVGRSAGAVLWLGPATDPLDPDGFSTVPAALAAAGVESVRALLPLDAEATPELVDALVAAWAAGAPAGRRTIAGGPDDAADAVLSLARRRSEPAVVAFAPRLPRNPIPDPGMAPTPLRAPTVLLLDRPVDLSGVAIDAADPRLTALRIERPMTSGEWPIRVLELPFGDPDRDARMP